VGLWQGVPNEEPVLRLPQLLRRNGVERVKLDVFPDRSDDWAAGVVKGFLPMKMLRNLLLALFAFTVLAGSVVPANAAIFHHHRAHHHHHKR
jgi:hypothetical protein